jgi:putative oxidoreductase
MGSVTAVLLIAGRIFISVFILISGVTKIARNKTMVEYAKSKKMPLPDLAIAGAALVELAGGISIAIGFYATIAAAVLFIYLIPTTIVFHDFWAAPEAERQNQAVHFMKNLAIMGGLLILASIA